MAQEAQTKTLNYTASQINNKLGQIENKVDKVSGKGLSTNDYTTAEKEAVANATNQGFSVVDGKLCVTFNS